MAALDSRARVALTSFFLFCFSLFLTAFSAQNAWVANLGSVIVGEVLRPFQSVFGSMSSRGSSLFDHYIALVDVSEENETLQRRIRGLEAENARLRESENEIARLRSILQATEALGLSGIAAEVIAVDPSNWVQVITLNRGSSDGVLHGMAVVDGHAVVGRVVAVSPNTARVLLVTDHTSSVDALVQSTRARGVFEGLGREHCRLRYVSEQENVAVGDLIITSGLDGVFPKGLLLGVVTGVEPAGEGMFHGVKVQPSANLGKLETVLIVSSSLPREEIREEGNVSAAARGEEQK